MDNLIYIWIVNRLLNFFGSITPFCVGSAALALMFYLFACGGMFNDTGEINVKHWTRRYKCWLIWSVIMCFFCGIFGAFKLDKTEFKTVAVYLIGKEIVQSKQGEKIITVIDTKLDEWIKKVEK